MRNLIYISLFLIAFTGVTQLQAEPIDELNAKFPSESEFLYNKMDLADKVDYKLFCLALKGYQQVADKGKTILTLIDFTKPSDKERFFVLDMKAYRLLYSTYVAHGKNSGENIPTRFSNKSGSYQSSLGFYLTSSTYQGSNGYSLRLKGLEPGINDQAMARAIVIHGAPYANPSVISSMGRLGRSLGCPALPPSISKEVIDTIKEGSLLFIYADTPDYKAQSAFVS